MTCPDAASREVHSWEGHRRNSGVGWFVDMKATQSEEHVGELAAAVQRRGSGDGEARGCDSDSLFLFCRGSCEKTCTTYRARDARVSRMTCEHLWSQVYLVLITPNSYPPHFPAAHPAGWRRSRKGPYRDSRRRASTAAAHGVAQGRLTRPPTSPRGTLAEISRATRALAFICGEENSTTHGRCPAFRRQLRRIWRGGTLQNRQRGDDTHSTKDSRGWPRYDGSLGGREHIREI